jgi:hypothetical protein
MLALLQRIRKAWHDPNSDDYFDGEAIEAELDELLGPRENDEPAKCAACQGEGVHGTAGEPPIRCTECNGTGEVT